jgi:hypothetical protein
MYFAIAWETWANHGPHRDNQDIVRDVRIQANKLLKMLDNEKLGISFEEMLGEKASLQKRKKRGKLHERTEAQHKKFIKCVETAIKRASESAAGRTLTKKELREESRKIEAVVIKIISLMKSKYPIEKMLKDYVPPNINWGTALLP